MTEADEAELGGVRVLDNGSVGARSSDPNQRLPKTGRESGSARDGGMDAGNDKHRTNDPLENMKEGVD